MLAIRLIAIGLVLGVWALLIPAYFGWPVVVGAIIDGFWGIWNEL